MSTSPFTATTGAAAINLMEMPPSMKDVAASPNTSDAAWFHTARFGMFVHYGLYSILGRGEWAMHFEKISPADYNRLADRFTADDFDADELVALAKQAGAGYVVLGARHHEGFCLWNTATTNFNSVKKAAGRDLIREYVDACRRAGLRVGIYYSVMSWQWPVIHTGPGTDPRAWKAMVAETHEQVRELMTNYGRIDYLWYDGCVVPGLGDATIRAKHWRARELNAMVRRLQPGILINDRAALPEDVTTPEQHLTPAPRGRVWECCQTMGRHWGICESDITPKLARELIGELIFCARYGGNYLLNVGPEADGRVPTMQAERMKEIGRWMAENGDAIRSSERTPYTEAQHLIGPATCQGETLYFHLARWPEQPARVAGITVPVASVRLLGGDADLPFEQTSDGCVTIGGLPPAAPLETIKVLAITLAEAPPHKKPPALLVERETGRHEPAEEPVRSVDGWQLGACQRLAFDVPATGVYHLELGIISAQAQRLTVTLNGRPLADSLSVECGNYPTTLRLRSLLLTQGPQRLELQATAATFGLYLWRLQPVWRVLPAKLWRTTGPFPTDFGPQGNDGQVRAALQTVFPPEQDAAHNRAEWKCHTSASETVNLGLLCGGDQTGVCYAQVEVHSPEARDLTVLLGCDWWANLFVNGRLVASGRDQADVARDGAWFNGWKPLQARVRLDAGKNLFLVKCHPGSTDNWFTFYINDPGDLELGA